MTFAVFHDYPGLEYGLPKFHDFPGPVVTLCYTTNPTSSETDLQAQILSCVKNR